MAHRGWAGASVNQHGAEGGTQPLSERRLPTPLSPGIPGLLGDRTDRPQGWREPGTRRRQDQLRPAPPTPVPQLRTQSPAAMREGSGRTSRTTRRAVGSSLGDNQPKLVIQPPVWASLVNPSQKWDPSARKRPGSGYSPHPPVTQAAYVKHWPHWRSGDHNPVPHGPPPTRCWRSRDAGELPFGTSVRSGTDQWRSSSSTAKRQTRAWGATRRGADITPWEPESRKQKPEL